jgi:hypothetical protein
VRLGEYTAATLAQLHGATITKLFEDATDEELANVRYTLFAGLSDAQLEAIPVSAVRRISVKHLFQGVDQHSYVTEVPGRVLKKWGIAIAVPRAGTMIAANEAAQRLLVTQAKLEERERLHWVLASLLTLAACIVFALLWKMKIL